MHGLVAVLALRYGQVGGDRPYRRLRTSPLLFALAHVRETMAGVSQSDSGPKAAAPPKSRGNPSLGDILRSVAVLAAIVLAIGAIATFLFDQSAPPRPTVDYLKTAEQARTQASFELLAPPDLPKGWRATSATYEPGVKGRWHLGVLVPGDDYVGLEQSAISERRMVERYASDTEPAGQTTIDGQTWNLRRDPEKNETTIVRGAGGVTTLVTGTVTRAQLEDYTASLTAG